MASAADLLSAARAELGYDRYTDPLEGTKYGRWMAQKTGQSWYGATGVAYCAMFVSYLLDKVGATCAGFPGAYCPTIHSVASAAGKVRSDKRDAQPGDVVLFDWDPQLADGPDHVGIVEANMGSYVQCIEGNVDGGKVQRRTRAWSTVYSVIAPDWAAVKEQVKVVTRAATSSVGETGPLAIDGYFGPLTKRYLQSAIQSRGYYVGYAVDGVWGYYSRWSLQRYLRYCRGSYQRACDGVFGYYSVYALQETLKQIGVYRRDDSSTPLVDGIWGTYTTKAVQRAINAGLI